MIVIIIQKLRARKMRGYMDNKQIGNLILDTLSESDNQSAEFVKGYLAGYLQCLKDKGKLAKL